MSTFRSTKFIETNWLRWVSLQLTHLASMANLRSTEYINVFRVYGVNDLRWYRLTAIKSTIIFLICRLCWDRLIQWIRFNLLSTLKSTDFDEIDWLRWNRLIFIHFNRLRWICSFCEKIWHETKQTSLRSTDLISIKSLRLTEDVKVFRLQRDSLKSTNFVEITWLW